jgi:TonB family protein
MKRRVEMSSVAGFVVSYAINSLWAVPLIGGAGWVVSRSMRKLGARAQHRMWVLTLGSAVLVPAMPSLLRGVLASEAAGQSNASIVLTAAQVGATGGRGATVLPSGIVLAVLIGYCGVLLYFAARLCWSMYWTAALVRESQPLQLGSAVEELWNKCRRMFGLGEIRLLRSARVGGPVTMGFNRPALLVPAGFAERCEPDELLAALAHECAHIERRDFGKNLAYEIASLLVAFHPVTWMLKRQIAETREMVCDEIAVESVMDSRRYAHSLLRLATMISVVSAAVQSNAIGIFDANILEKRIMTIRTKKEKVSAKYAVIVPAALLLFSVAIGEAAMRGIVIDSGTQSQATDAAKPYGQVYHVGKDVTAPSLISSVDPEFPASARKGKDKFEGTCLLSMVVDEKGVPRDVKVMRSLGQDFDAKAVEAVEKYRFRPATKAGEPVAVALKIEVDFKKF